MQHAQDRVSSTADCVQYKSEGHLLSASPGIFHSFLNLKADTIL